MELHAGKKVYFASDFHLGAPDPQSSLEREKRIVSWLGEIASDAAIIFLVGDLFDFWFEYKKVIPKGYTRILGMLASLRDQGIRIIVFTGNHDMWMDGYFEQELRIPVCSDPVEYQIAGKSFYVAHGDGLGPGDHGYKLLKKLFRSRFCRWLFAVLHPSTGIAIANFFSRKSRHMTAQKKFLGEDKEWLILHSREILREKMINFFIYGHRHLPLDISLGEGSRYINLGDWLNQGSYAVFDGESLQLLTYTGSHVANP
ncbi:MAG TPA: UDP-2,3-diacylglucosamine diphosphatase [Chitinophagaceae bacterium]|nr:UDP-2,3-diacylglucosamine diphosphatase [Chitinophagaceae bacterium]